MEQYRSLGRIRPQKLRCTALLGCMLVPVIFLAFLKSGSHTLAVLSLQLSIQTYVTSSTVEPSSTAGQPGIEMVEMPLDVRDNKEEVTSEAGDQRITPPPNLEEKQGENSSMAVHADKKVMGLSIVSNENQEEVTSKAGEHVTPSNLEKKQGGNSSMEVHANNKVMGLSTSNENQEEVTSEAGERITPPNLEEKQGKNSSIADNKVMGLSTVSNENQETSGIRVVDMSVDIKVDQSGATPKADTKMKTLPPNLEDKQAENKSIAVHADNKVAESSMVSKKNQERRNTIFGSPLEESKLICDFTEQRSDTCLAHGDVRVLGSSSSIILASPHELGTSNTNTSWKIRPYARKWELAVMKNIKELNLRSSNDHREHPQCTLSHKVPAVIFSTGGFLGNFFHDFTDVLIPLFITSRQYNQEVQFLATDFNSRWIDKYQLILKQLSRYDIINLDSDKRVHCFQHVHVGLMSHKVLGIDPAKSPNGYSMADFRALLRTCLSLKRRSVKSIEAKSRKKPRLLILLRKGPRSLTNPKEVIAMARSLGYKVVAATPEKTRNLTQFARVVNSCDVMMGVHGAGLANMIFLPANATLIQIVPWGGLAWACRHDFGEPAPDMAIRYLQYEIKEEESSLINQYPRNHAVFRDPLSIHRQGWNVLWSIFLNKQQIKLDVSRFRKVLLGVLQSQKV